ncbi:hypothetical protein VXE65_20895 [Mycolicibacterium conceptionense]
MTTTSALPVDWAIRIRPMSRRELLARNAHALRRLSKAARGQDN